MSKVSDRHADGDRSTQGRSAAGGDLPGDDNEPLPGAVLTPRQTRYLKIAIVVMGVMILVILALIVSTILLRSGKPRTASGTAAGDPAASAAIRSLYANQEKILFAEGVIPAGSRIVSSHIDGDRLVMMLERKGGASILLFDLKAWQVIGLAQLDHQP